MINEKFPNWDIDVEKGTVYSLYWKKYIGTNDKNGYIHLKDNLLHRVIWECVNGEIPNGYEVHHIDGNKQNNSIYNLELIGHKEHRTKHKKGIVFSEEHKNKIKESNRNNPKQHPKSIAQYTLEGELVNLWVSARQIERELGFYHSNISKCCKGLCNHSYGYMWKYNGEGV